jgi:hypothetical protein
VYVTCCRRVDNDEVLRAGGSDAKAVTGFQAGESRSQEPEPNSAKYASILMPYVARSALLDLRLSVNSEVIWMAMTTNIE